MGLWTGAAFDANGAAQAGMGVAVGDADGDGNLDVFVTNFSEDFSTLYKGLVSGFFEDASIAAGVGEPTFIPLSWGTVFADLDNDTDLDLVIANGHIYPQVDRHRQFGLSYRQANLLLENIGTGRFVNATGRAGPGFALLKASRGLAAGDYDNDGDLDLLVTNLDEPPTLLRNDSSTGSWLTLLCQTPPGSGTVIGTRVVVTVGRKKMMRDIASGGSYLSVHDARVHFGLGLARTVDRIEVRWPDGGLSVLEDVAGNQIIKVVKEPQ